MAETFTNTLYTNDNLFVLYGMNSASVDLIYLDPPFNSKRTYSAPIGSKAAGASFKDMWTWQDVNEAYLDKLVDHYPALVRYIQSVEGISGKPMMAYLVYMVQRLIEMHRVLKDTGSLYLHCDPTASHYLKVLCDSVFGKQNFCNEILWCYTQGGRPKDRFPNKHDIILFYAKTKNHHFYPDRIKIPYELVSKKSADSFTKIDEAGRAYKEIYGTDHREKYRYYKDEGKIPYDWWIDIPQITGRAAASKSSERTGYPTQKPLALLHRIIKASSQEGDVVFDPFCGCATTCVAAQQLKRRWIGIDIEAKAAEVLVERLSNDAGLFKDFIRLTEPPVRTDVVIEPANQVSIKKRLYTAQNGQCQACRTDFEMRNLEVDHIIPKAKGGGDYYENYQLLCASCNRIKGARPMEYLRVKIKAREEMLKKDITFGA